MKYIKIDKFDTGNAHGIATVLWVSGCSHMCDGCHNPETWDCEYGKYFDEGAKEELLKAIMNEHVPNVVLSGGDPLFKKNVKDMEELVKEIKRWNPNKTIILYTGFTVKEIIRNHDYDRLRVLANVDYIIDGKFEKDNKTKILDLRGSYNQQCYEVNAGAGGVIFKNRSLDYFKCHSFTDIEKEFEELYSKLR